MSCVSLNFGIIITGIVGFYGLTAAVDLLLLLLTENLRMWADFSVIENLNWRWLSCLRAVGAERENVFLIDTFLPTHLASDSRSSLH